MEHQTGVGKDRGGRAPLCSCRATWSIPRSRGLPIYLVRNEGSIWSEVQGPQKARETRLKKRQDDVSSAPHRKQPNYELYFNAKLHNILYSYNIETIVDRYIFNVLNKSVLII